MKKSSALIEPSSFAWPSHGGQVCAAAEWAGRSPQGIVDFSVNLNPWGPPQSLIRAWPELFRETLRYPDPDSTALRERIASRLGLDPAGVAIGNGSMELIHALPRLMDANHCALIVDPCFSEYERVFRTAGRTVHSHFLSETNHFTEDPDALCRRVEDTADLGALVVGSPNNPTGTLWTRDALAKTLKACDLKRAYLIVDETFIDFAGEEFSASALLPESEYLIVIRSFTKFFSIPGLRLGYALTAPDTRKKLEAGLPHWSVNACAQAAGILLLDDEDFRRDSLERFRVEHGFLYWELSGLKPLSIIPSEASFILFRLREGMTPPPEEFYLESIRRGILLRNCGNFRGLDANWFRAAVRNREDNLMLLDNLNKILASA